MYLVNKDPVQYLIFYKKNSKNVHGSFIEGPKEGDFTPILKNIERFAELPDSADSISVNSLQPYKDYNTNLCFYLEEDTPVILAGPEVSEKQIKELKRHLKATYNSAEIKVFRLLILKNWYPPSPFKQSSEQKLIKNVEQAQRYLQRQIVKSA